jgi:hypothetical protein
MNSRIWAILPSRAGRDQKTLAPRPEGRGSAAQLAVDLNLVGTDSEHCCHHSHRHDGSIQKIHAIVRHLLVDQP